MDILPETVKKVAYPALAAAMAAALSACDRQPQRMVGKQPADRTETEVQRTGGIVAEQQTANHAPQHVDGIPPVPEMEPEVPLPPTPEDRQQIPGEPPVDFVKK